MHRSLFPLAALMAALALPASAQPALAQEAPAPADAAPGQAHALSLEEARKLYADTGISHEADLALYCGAGFHLLAAMAAAAQNSEAESFEKLSKTLLSRADTLLTKDGLSFDQRSRLAEAVTVVANEQVIRADEPPRYSQDECTAAVPSAH